MKVWMSAVIAALLALAVFTVPGGATRTALAETNVCGNDVIDVPDTGATFDFTAACQGHDDCYALGGDESARRTCDSNFLSAMQEYCQTTYPTQFFKRWSCNTVATTYYLGVHLFGWLFFPYST
jgi:hypothetical protein